MADVPGHELAGCGSIVISARRTAVRKIVSEGDERRSSVSSEGRSSPRTTTLLRTFSGRSAPDGDAIQAYIKILIQLERLDAATQENVEVCDTRMYAVEPFAFTMSTALPSCAFGLDYNVDSSQGKSPSRASLICSGVNCLCSTERPRSDN